MCSKTSCLDSAHSNDNTNCVLVSAGAQCCVELRIFAEAIQWCDEGLKAHPTDKKLLELRAAADKNKVRAQRGSFDF